jgi:hypothetical protein
MSQKMAKVTIKGDDGEVIDTKPFMSYADAIGYAKSAEAATDYPEGRDFIVSYIGG